MIKIKIKKQELKEAGLIPHLTFWAVNNPAIALGVIGTFAMLGLNNIANDVAKAWKKADSRKKIELEKKLKELESKINEKIMKVVSGEPQFKYLFEIYTDAKAREQQRISSTPQADVYYSNMMGGPPADHPTETLEAAKEIQELFRQQHPEEFQKIKQEIEQEIKNNK